MTGRKESPDPSPNNRDEDKSNGSAMHTLAPAKSPNQPLLHHLHNANSNGDTIETEYSLPVPLAPSATPVPVVETKESASNSESQNNESWINYTVKIEKEDSGDGQSSMDKSDDNIVHDLSVLSKLDSHPSMMITSELLRLIPGENDTNDDDNLLNDDNHCSFNMSSDDTFHYGRMNHSGISNGSKAWSQQDMENALDALRNHNMSLTKASSTYGIPSTTLWQRAHRLGIDTPKKEGPSKSWSEGNLHSALQALRTGTISANKASKAYGIPSSTLYKIARREGIRLAAPFNAAPTTWKPGDLEKALNSIRSGQSSVQKASTEFGIPTGTLYGRCKREGIELSRSNPTPWSEDAMGEALEAVRIGQMSINQAAIHYNLPYSSLYGRFKRCKFDSEMVNTLEPQVQIHTGHELNNLPLRSQNSSLHNAQNSPRHPYPGYNHHHQHHPLTIPNPIREHSESNNVTPHNNQDCVSIS